MKSKRYCECGKKATAWTMHKDKYDGNVHYYCMICLVKNIFKISSKDILRNEEIEECGKCGKTTCSH
jgi:hypothetical protein